MTAKQLMKYLRKVAEDTEIVVGGVEIAEVERQFANRKMFLNLILKK